LEARTRFPDHPTSADAYSKNGSMNLARCALGVLASQKHADAAKLLRRWEIEEAGKVCGSLKFEEDAGKLASEVCLLMLKGNVPSRKTFGEALLDRMYPLLGLRRPREALKKKQARAR
jgi:hypothetical protein